MKIFESIGFDAGTGSDFVVGYFIQGENGLYTFSETKTPDKESIYNIDLNESLPYIRELIN